jgi:hypothetical protein
MDSNTKHKAEQSQTHGRRLWPIGAIVLLLVLALAAYLLARVNSTAPVESDSADAAAGNTDAAGLSAPAPARRTAGARRCEFFVTQKILSARQPTVLDQWEADGKQVFQVGFQVPGKDGQRVRLCIYDPEKRHALLPAVEDQDAWLPAQSGTPSD